MAVRRHVQEASIQWEKRQAAIRARRQAEENKSKWAAWASAAGVATGKAAAASSVDYGYGAAAPADPRVATAAAAAAAARRCATPLHLSIRLANGHMMAQLIQLKGTHSQCKEWH